MIGESPYLNRGGYFQAGKNENELIISGKNVYIGSCCSMSCFTYTVGPESCKAERRIANSIEIGDGTWIGIGTIILPGVKIGSGCVVDAGALVNKDLDSNAIYVGVPARNIKNL
ncbi:TPA: acyltransferase [Enterococcus faecium]|uniref:acyltransferase n=1 Tax=Enterococcus faecium TaxID=1352 RepID=UPI0002A3674A|nr:acyltransferase [Enterococcus faecium]ELA59269.1 hypothetical protein OGG_03548 [Enterococcus faecium EnGen0013]EOF93740.1 hypothetical protein SKG_01157 [Enterococcus faecium EnGen0166]MDV7710309.1 acyltransferase [Enterococcus faecium]MDW3723007.1 acyltransferase [Enterococcus faecium]HAQ7384501.1 acyltransferase [Enterococcus faecium]